MTPEQKRLVRETWALVAPNSRNAGALFYVRLFTLDPSLREVFKNADMQDQARKLMQVLAYAVAALDRLETLDPALAVLGRQHAQYGVLDRDYDTAANALLWALGRGLGPLFTREAREAWAAVYATLTTVMRNAAAGVTPLATPAIPA